MLLLLGSASAHTQRRAGFTLVEVAIAVVLIVLVATTAIASLRIGMKTMTGTELAATSSSVIRQFREFTFNDTIEELDARDGQTYAPVLGNGDPMTGVDGIEVRVQVTAVDDYDPSVTVDPAESRTRVVAVETWLDGEQKTMEAVWLVAEH